MSFYSNAPPANTNTNTVGVGVGYDEAAQALISTFGPTPVLSRILHDYQGRGELITSSTLAEAVVRHDSFSSTQTAELKVVIERQYGWHTVFAPLQKTDKLQMTYNREIANRFTLDRVPEGVAPRFVNSRTTSKSFQLVHYNLGARFHHEFYKTPEGRKQAQQRQQIIIVAAIIACKLAVSAAIVRSDLYYRKNERLSGSRYKSVFEAQAGEVSRFGAFNKDPRAIYKIAHYIDETVQRLSANGQGDLVPLTNYVVGSGLLNQITVSNKAETEVARRDPDVTTKMLSLGARALPSVLPGRVIFEDPSWSLENVSVEELNVFRRVAIVGQYYMIDGSRVGANGAPLGSNIKDELSVKVPDADRDDYARYGIEDALRQSMRFSETGDLSPKHEHFRRELPNTLAKLGIHLENPRAVDPYIWRVANALDTGNGANVREEDYRVATYYGDMDYLYWSKEQMFQHARAAAAAVRSTAQVTAEFSNALRDFRSLISDLYNLPTTLTAADKNALLVYVYAVCEINFSAARADLEPNVYGSLKLPTITNIAGKLYFGYDSDTFTLGRDPANLKFTRRAAVDVAADDAVVPVGFQKNLARPWGFSALHHFRTLAELDDTPNYALYEQSYFKRAKLLVPIIDNYLETLRRVYPHSELWSPLYVPSYAASGSNQPEYDSLHSVACNVLDRVRHPLWFKFAAGSAASKVVISTDTRLRQLVANAFNGGLRYDSLTGLYTIAALRTTTSDAQKFVLEAVDYARELLTTSSIAQFSAQFQAIIADTVTSAEDKVAVALANPNGGTPTVLDFVTQVVALLIERVVKNYGFHSELSFLKSLSSGDYTALTGRWATHANLGGSMENPNAANAPFDGFIAAPWLAWIALVQANNDKAKIQNVEKVAVHMFATLVNTLTALNNNYQNINIRLSRATIQRLADNAASVPSETAYRVSSADAPLRKRARDDGMQSSATAYSCVNSRLLFNPEIFRALNIELSRNVFALGTLVFPEHPDTGVPMYPTNSATLSQDEVVQRVVSNSRVGFQRDATVGVSGTVFANQQLLAFTDQNKRRRTTTYEDGLSSAITLASENADNYSLGSGFDSRGGNNYLSVSVRHNATGPLYSVDSGSAKQQLASIVERHILIGRANALANESQDDETRIAGFLCIFSKIHLNTPETWLSFNLPIPDSCFIIAHPFIRLETEAMVAFANNAGTMYYAHEDVSNQLTNDSKQWLLHYTIWLGCLIQDETKLMVLPDVRIVGYQGGLDLQVYDRLDDFDARSLDFKKSAFVFSCGSTFSRDAALKHANPLSLFGKFDVSQFACAFENEQRVFSQAPQWPAALFYAFLWGFGAMNRTNESSIVNYQSLSENHEAPEVTGLLYMGRHMAWSTSTRDHTIAIRGTGHLGNIDPPFNEVFTTGITFDSSKSS